MLIPAENTNMESQDKMPAPKLSNSATVGSGKNNTAEVQDTDFNYEYVQGP